MDEKWVHVRGCWQAWLTEAVVKEDVDEVKRRLLVVPESMRESVREHARTVYALRNR